MKSRVYEPYLCKNLHVVQAFIACKEVVVTNKAVRGVEMFIMSHVCVNSVVCCCRRAHEAASASGILPVSGSFSLSGCLISLKA